MCIPQIIWVQVMHDSPDAEDAGIVEGGEEHNLVFHVNYVFIAPFML